VLWKSKEKVSATLEKEKRLLKNRFYQWLHMSSAPLSTAHLSASLIEKYAEPLENTNITKHAGKIISATNLATVLNDFYTLNN
jgi:hypothetical protein